MGVSRTRQFPLAALPLRIPAVMRTEYEAEVSSAYGAAGIIPSRTRKSGPASGTFLNEQTQTLCGVQGRLLSACGYQHPDWKKYGSLGCGLFSSASPGAIK